MGTRAQFPLLVATAAIALAAGCSGGADEAEPSVASTPSTSTTESATAPVDTGMVEAGATCDEAVAAVAREGSGSPEVLDAFGFAAPDACASVDELSEAVAAHDLVGLDDFVISSCVAGDAWALLGQPSVTADTELCREARSRFTLTGGRRLAPARPVHSEDFSSGCGDWHSPGSLGVRFSCEEQDYSFLVTRAGTPWHSLVEIERPFAELSIEADAALVAPETAVNAYYGVSCWASEDLGYVFALDPVGRFVIARVDKTGAATGFLARGETLRAITGLGLRNRIRGECAASAFMTRLALFVNGERVAAARDRRDAKSFETVGLYVVTDAPGTDVRFDNVLVRVPGR